ncbi:MAG: flavin reductase family protein [Euzebyales bacterium]|nr:flavin reductase family protein [Euzebyales bacterium]
MADEALDYDVDPVSLPARECYYLMTSLCVPRPIAWVSSLDGDGRRNLAPHSYFNVISSAPPILHFTSSGEKDSLRNVLATGEFVVNVVSADLVEVMNLTAADFPPQEDEFDWAGLEAVASARVAPPRVARARAAMECRVRDTVTMGNGTMVFGDVVHIHVDAAVWRDGRVDPDLLEPVGRLAGSNYAVAAPVFGLRRPTWEQVRSRWAGNG